MKVLSAARAGGADAGVVSGPHAVVAVVARACRLFGGAVVAVGAGVLAVPCAVASRIAPFCERSAILSKKGPKRGWSHFSAPGLRRYTFYLPLMN